MKGFKPNAKMSHSGKVMKKAVGGMASGGGGKPIDLGSTPSMKGGSGKPINLPIDLGSTPSIKGKGGGGGGRPAPRMIPGPNDFSMGPGGSLIRPGRGGMNYIGGSKDFDESTGTYRGRPGGMISRPFKKGGSIKGESEMKKSDSKMKVMKKAIGGGISGGPTRVGPKPMPSNPLNRGSIGNLPTRANPTAPRQSNPMDRGSISRMKKGGSAKGRKGMK